jgi:hypothetical protein
LAIAAGILTAGYLRTSGLGTRIIALETITRAHEGELDRFRSQSQFLTRGDADGDTDERKTSLKSGSSASTPEHKNPAVTALQQSAPAPTPSAERAGISGAADATGSPAAGVTQAGEVAASTIAESAGMTDRGAASVYVESHDAEKHGPWVINLMSSPNKSDADRFAEKAMKQGIPVEQNTIRLKDREFFRVQLTGFQTEKQAEHNAGPVKDKLGLKDVWIFKP